MQREVFGKLENGTADDKLILDKSTERKKITYIHISSPGWSYEFFNNIANTPINERLYKQEMKVWILWFLFWMSISSKWLWLFIYLYVCM